MRGVHALEVNGIAGDRQFPRVPVPVGYRKRHGSAFRAVTAPQHFVRGSGS